MLEVKYNGEVAVLDVRERVLRGEHPKQEILQFVQEAKQGTVIEIHLPHKAEPLVAALESIGVSSILNQLGDHHFRLMCVKM